MFLDFFDELRAERVPLTIQEWLTFMDALGRGLHGGSLTGFYRVARACLIKSETHYDAFDRAFYRVFHGVEGALDLGDELMEWLKDPRNFPALTAEQLALLEQLSAQELMDKLRERLAEQEGRHDGGSRWIGTGGSSPFGHSGRHPTGIRVGGQSGGRSAMKVAESRRYLGYRTDVTMDIRQIKVALRRLRQLVRSGDATELDVPGTIDTTCRNAGEIELKFIPPRRNEVRLLLCMDVGGTMDPYSLLMSQLLSALRQTHGLRDFRFYYFHNCIYDRLYTHPWLRQVDGVPVQQVMRELDGRWKLMVVGDAAMHPAELLHPYGNIDHGAAVETPGWEWLKLLRRHFTRSVWLNPDPPSAWGGRTVQAIASLFPMYTMSVEGLSDAVKALVAAKPEPGTVAG